MRKGTPIFTKGLQHKLRKEQEQERERKARLQNEQIQGNSSVQGQTIKRNTSNPTFPLIKDFDEEVHVGEFVRTSHHNLHEYEQQQRSDQQALLDSKEDLGGKSGSKVSGSSPQKEDQESKNTRILIICFLLIIVVGALNKIFGKLQTIPMKNYGNFMNLFMTFCYIPLSFIYVWPMYKYGYIKKEEVDAPIKAFVIMGFLDGIAGIMQVFATIYLAGSEVVLLQQAAIPVSMIISKLLIKVRYSPMQYIGALIVIGGILVVLGPSLGKKTDDSSETDASSDSTTSGANQMLWALIMIFSCIPMTLSSVYKEIALVNNDLDPIYLNGMVAIFQFLISIPLAIPAAMTTHLSISDLPQNLYDGFRCYIGKNSEEGDDCYLYAPLYVNLYIIMNVLYNILIICIVKYGSANLLWLAMTISVPIANIAFSFKFMGEAYEKATMTSYYGLIVIMLGLICYRFGNAFYENLVERCSSNKDINHKEKDVLYEPLTTTDGVDDEEYKQVRSQLKRTESC